MLRAYFIENPCLTSFKMLRTGRPCPWYAFVNNALNHIMWVCLNIWWHCQGFQLFQGLHLVEASTVFVRCLPVSRECLLQTPASSYLEGLSRSNQSHNCVANKYKCKAVKCLPVRWSPLWPFKFWLIIANLGGGYRTLSSGLLCLHQSANVWVQKDTETVHDFLRLLSTHPGPWESTQYSGALGEWCDRLDSLKFPLCKVPMLRFGFV